jgi:hypothetical protein
MVVLSRPVPMARTRPIGTHGERRKAGTHEGPGVAAEASVDLSSVTTRR